MLPMDAATYSFGVVIKHDAEPTRCSLPSSLQDMADGVLWPDTSSQGPKLAYKLCADQWLDKCLSQGRSGAFIVGGAPGSSRAATLGCLSSKQLVTGSSETGLLARAVHQMFDRLGPGASITICCMEEMVIGSKHQLLDLLAAPKSSANSTPSPTPISSTPRPSISGSTQHHKGEDSGSSSLPRVDLSSCKNLPCLVVVVTPEQALAVLQSAVKRRAKWAKKRHRSHLGAAQGGGTSVEASSISGDISSQPTQPPDSPARQAPPVEHMGHVVFQFSWTTKAARGQPVSSSKAVTVSFVDLVPLPVPGASSMHSTSLLDTNSSSYTHVLARQDSGDDVAASNVQPFPAALLHKLCQVAGRPHTTPVPIQAFPALQLTPSRHHAQATSTDCISMPLAGRLIETDSNCSRSGQSSSNGAATASGQLGQAQPLVMTLLQESFDNLVLLACMTGAQHADAGVIRQLWTLAGARKLQVPLQEHAPAFVEPPLRFRPSIEQPQANVNSRIGSLKFRPSIEQPQHKANTGSVGSASRGAAAVPHPKVPSHPVAGLPTTPVKVATPVLDNRQLVKQASIEKRPRSCLPSLHRRTWAVHVERDGTHRPGAPSAHAIDPMLHKRSSSVTPVSHLKSHSPYTASSSSQLVGAVYPKAQPGAGEGGSLRTLSRRLSVFDGSLAPSWGATDPSAEGGSRVMGAARLRLQNLYDELLAEFEAFMSRERPNRRARRTSEAGLPSPTPPSDHYLHQDNSSHAPASGHATAVHSAVQHTRLQPIAEVRPRSTAPMLRGSTSTTPAVTRTITGGGFLKQQPTMSPVASRGLFQSPARVPPAANSSGKAGIPTLAAPFTPGSSMARPSSSNACSAGTTARVSRVGSITRSGHGAASPARAHVSSRTELPAALGRSRSQNATDSRAATQPRAALLHQSSARFPGQGGSTSTPAGRQLQSRQQSAPDASLAQIIRAPSITSHPFMGSGRAARPPASSHVPGGTPAVRLTRPPVHPTTSPISAAPYTLPTARKSSTWDGSMGGSMASCRTSRVDVSTDTMDELLFEDLLPGLPETDVLTHHTPGVASPHVLPVSLLSLRQLTQSTTSAGNNSNHMSSQTHGGFASHVPQGQSRYLSAGGQSLTRSSTDQGASSGGHHSITRKPSGAGEAAARAVHAAAHTNKPQLNAAVLTTLPAWARSLYVSHVAASHQAHPVSASRPPNAAAPWGAHSSAVHHTGLEPRGKKATTWEAAAKTTQPHGRAAPTAPSPASSPATAGMGASSQEAARQAAARRVAATSAAAAASRLAARRRAAAKDAAAAHRPSLSGTPAGPTADAPAFTAARSSWQRCSQASFDVASPTGPSHQGTASPLGISACTSLHSSYNSDHQILLVSRQ